MPAAGTSPRPSVPGPDSPAGTEPLAPVSGTGSAELRYDPTAGEWVTLAAHRQDRTYQPATAECPLCPSRPGGPVTEIPYRSFEVAVFDNRFPSYRPDAGGGPPGPGAPHRGGRDPASADESLWQTAPAGGRCEVVVYSDRHDATFADLPATRAELLAHVWARRTEALANEAAVAYVMPFENKGELIGATLPHPHGQIYGYPMVPPRRLAELTASLAYRERTGRCPWCDAAEAEAADGTRVVATVGQWVVLVPFWARLPYQVEVVPRQHAISLMALTNEERDELGRVMSMVSRAYDRLWGFSLPYIMALAQAPVKNSGAWAGAAHLRATFLPLHRDAGRVKYLAGSELAAGAFLNDVRPEEAAAALREAMKRTYG